MRSLAKVPGAIIHRPGGGRWRRGGWHELFLIALGNRPSEDTRLMPETSGKFLQAISIWGREMGEFLTSHSPGEEQEVAIKFNSKSVFCVWVTVTRQSYQLLGPSFLI